MSIIDRFFVGKVIKDFGPLEEKYFVIGKSTKSALLAERGGRLAFVLKFSSWMLILGRTSYFELDLEDAYKLREFINQAEQIARYKAIANKEV
jgi:hypothetical protein